MFTKTSSEQPNPECFTLDAAIDHVLDRSQDRIVAFQGAMTALDLQSELSTLLAGKVFDASSRTYTLAEQQSFLDDLKNNLQADLYSKPCAESTGRPHYLSTAGAPGSGKSYYAEHLPTFNRYVYVDPDRNGLEKLTIYKSILATTNNREQAYAIARSASNFYAQFLFVLACAEKKNILHGTTATSRFMPIIYKGLKEQGYAIELHLIMVTDPKDRAAALQLRIDNTDVVQVTQQDATTKISGFFDRILDNSYQCADTIVMLLQPKEFYTGSQPVKIDEATASCIAHISSEDPDRLRAGKIEQNLTCLLNKNSQQSALKEQSEPPAGFKP